MAVDLPGDDRSLNTRQKLLRFRQGQTQVRDIAKIFRPTDFYQIGAWAARVIPGRNRRMNKSQQMRWSRRGADLLLQVRCAVYNGTLGSGLGHRFQPHANQNERSANAA
jgi:hypothetical protein